MKIVSKYLTTLSIILLGMNLGTNAQTTTFLYTGAIQAYTVPAGVCQINISASGAQGGASSFGTGGLGANISASFPVTPGEVLNILVGQQPMATTYAAGGGGGSFVWVSTASTPLIAAGGGGGAGDASSSSGINASTTTSGTNGGGGATYGGAGTAGSGGVALTGTCGGVYGAGGAGWGSSGAPGGTTTCTAATGGSNPLLGGAGGMAGGISGESSNGGFGGGGGGQASCAGTFGGSGGGGGYSGGGGGNFVCVGPYDQPGGGGGSYIDVSGTGAVSTVTNTGNGFVVITVSATVPVPGAVVGKDTMCVGAHQTLTDPTGTTGGAWSSSNTAAATVGSLTGTVTAIAAGTSVLSYVTTTPCGIATATTTITVLTGIGAITGTNKVCSQQNDTLSVPTPGGAWTSSNTAIAIVGSTGHVTGEAAGAVIISYSIGSGCVATFPLTVNPLPLPIVGDTFVCRYLTDDLHDATPGGTWSGSNPTLGSIDPTTGIFTAAFFGGNDNINYTLPTGCSVSHLFPLRVNTPAGSLYGTLAGNDVLCQYYSDTLTMASYEYPAGVWSTSDASVATVTDLGYPYGGLITGVSGGTALISYNVVSCLPSVDTVIINPAPKPIDGLASICTGIPVSLADSTPGGTWSSSDTSVAVIDSITGIVTVRDTVLGSSTDIIYALPTGCSTNLVVTVNSGPAPITGYDSVCKGLTDTLRDDTSGGIWTSTALAIAQVIDSSGVVFGISSGLVNISYTLRSGCYATVPFYVEPPVPATISITDTPNVNDTILCAGSPVRFYSTTTNAGTPTFQWQVFDTGIAGQTSDSLVYTPRHGDVVILQVVTHGVCALHDTVYDSVAINVYPVGVEPIVTIVTSDTSGIIYSRLFPGTDSTYKLQFPGQVITFYSNLVYGGPSPTYQWFRNGLPIPGANASSYSTPVYSNDTFSCEVTGYPPCDLTAHTAASNIITIWGNYLGVNTLSAATGGLSIFPNPNNGGFALSGKINTASDNKVAMQVLDVLGNIVYSATTTAQNGVVNQTITLDDNLANGAYILRVNSGNDNETLHFVISK